MLSTSALRGRVLRRLGPGALDVEAPWLGAMGASDGLLAGCAWGLLPRAGDEDAGASDHHGRTVVGLDRFRGPGSAGHGERGRLRLAAPDLPPDAALEGAAFEIHSPDEAPILAARLLTGTPQGALLPPLELRLATTRGTNALLERTGAPTAFFVTRGFADLLMIGDQARPDLFALAIRKPEPLYAAVVEVAERVAADGSVVVPFTPDDELRGRAAGLVAAGVRSAAVAFLHSYRAPQHEERMAAVLRELGFTHVSLSSALAPLIKIVPRAETAVVDAYLAPVIGDYLARVADALSAEGEGAGRGSTVQVMTSAGGLAPAGDFRAKDSLLSGPAGGVVGAAAAGRRAGLERLITFDMGGTSTDVARYDGDFEYVFEHRVGDAHLVAPALAIETVAAGGGSICRFAEGRLTVGPESAGAAPGPACYGAGGPLTLTDVNLLLGRLDGAHFGVPVDREATERRLAELLDAVGGSAGEAPAREHLLAGCLEIADERMADAVRRISVRRGYDPEDYALVAFGGAGGQHACAVAGLLGIETVLVPADAGLLSAFGLGTALVERFAQRQMLAPLDRVAGDLPRWLDELGAAAVGEVLAAGVPGGEAVVRRRIVQLRLAGQESALPVEAAEPSELAEAFHAGYEELYGYPPPERPIIEVESLRVVASERPREDPPEPEPAAARRAEPFGTRRVYFAGDWGEVPVFERARLAAGDTLTGPALVFERHAATVVAPGWESRVAGGGGLLLRRSVRRAEPPPREG